MKRDSRRKYYWILCKDPETQKSMLIKGDFDESIARQKAFELLSGIEFEIRGLYTTNMASASQMIRGKRLEDTHDLHTAKQKLGHERSVRRMMRKRRQDIDY